MWDCPKCGTIGIMGLPNCPNCGAGRPEDSVSTLVLPAKDVSAVPETDAGVPDSLAGEDEEFAAAGDPEPQTLAEAEDIATPKVSKADEVKVKK